MNQQFQVVAKQKNYGSNLQTAAECLEDLKTNYNTPGHPIAFSGVKNIYDFYGGKLKLEEIENVLASVHNYSLHREFHKGQRNISYSHYKRYQFQMDLVFIEALAPFNDNVKYILTAIDTFTRFAFVRLLKDKTGPSVLKAFQSILTEAVDPPKMLVIDRGTEFFNKEFLAFCKQKSIEVYPPDSFIHAAYIERFNRTFQSLLYKYLTENETNRYIDKTQPDGTVVDVVNALLASYNNRKHRMIGITPQMAETNPDLHLDMRLRMTKYYETIKKKPKKFEIGTLVRIAKIPGKFSRGYQQRAVDEVFRIRDVKLNKKIPMFVLENYHGNEVIKGNFYSFELTRVNSDIFRIEKVIRSRRKNGRLEHYVKWQGYDETYNSWIDADAITQVFK
jgi:transposase InsO family protein